MKREFKVRRQVMLCVVVLLSFLYLLLPAPGHADLFQEQRDKYSKLYNDGNYKDAYEGFSQLALDPNDDPLKVGEDMNKAVDCLRNLNRNDESDAFLEKVIDIHKNNWHLLFATAQKYMNIKHYGYIVAGQFYRGNHRGGGRYVNSYARDRLRSLQLMTEAIKQIEQDKESSKDYKGWELADFYLRFADMILDYSGYHQAWRLQYLSDLSQFPNYDDGYYYGSGNIAAPVNPEGTPVYYYLPKSYIEAENDGQRWRWLLMQTVETDPGRINDVRYKFANFLKEQFGVQTMSDYAHYFNRGSSQANSKEEKEGVYALHTLSEEETMARLATGIKRFLLPDEFNFIKIYKQIINSRKESHVEDALDRLAEIFEDRRQYDRAADYWKQSLNKGQSDWKQKRLEQIVKNWGIFEPIMTQPAGQGATVEYRFRNGQKVSFEVYKIKEKELLADLKEYLRSNPPKLDWGKINLNNIGYRLVEKEESKYLGEKVASWDLELEPKTNHFDSRITITTPLQKPGGYLLVAKMEDGNLTRIIVWLNDTVIVKKQLDKKNYIFVADAVTGRSISKASVEFFGYKQEYVGDKIIDKVERKLTGREYEVNTTELVETTDPDGQIITGSDKLSNKFNWLITATTTKGRFSYLGFSNIWYSNYYNSQYNEVKTFVITDRPVYRPDQTMRFKFWIHQAQYDQEDTSSFANQSITIYINNPKGEKIFEKQYTTDVYAGLEGEFAIPKDATLGQYYIYQSGYGNRRGYFRVEEYKKPEFEVRIDTPVEPVMLGEKITATINARYLFGAPVTKARVKYKVLRSDYNEGWYPSGLWDWFYGRGYWWYAYDYSWYPGWRSWGCKRPSPWWWRTASNPPELLMENEVEINEDGKVKVEIDTTLAKEIHGDKDHGYEITAEVVDESRRTIVGTGSVLVPREPFKVYAWVDRGYYRVGDQVKASFRAQKIDGKPVQGKGRADLFLISYDKDYKPIETLVQSWEINPNEEGSADLTIKASQAGQYRISYKVAIGPLSEKKGLSNFLASHLPNFLSSRLPSLSSSQLPDFSSSSFIEGGYIFNIAGEGFEASEFRCNDLELINDKKEYQPGEKVNLMVNTNRPESTVLLFIRPANGVCLEPKILHLKGKSILEEIEVTKKDMPNFFVEALTISNGKLYNEVREIVVPPEKRVLNIEVIPSAQEYKPAEEAKVKLRLTDFYEEPFVGSVVLTVYDKAVEYISGGSNVPEIKAFFWKWRRQHSPRSESNLDNYFYNLICSGEIGMGEIGSFGYLVQEYGGLGEVDTCSLEKKICKSEKSFQPSPQIRGFANDEDKETRLNQIVSDLSSKSSRGGSKEAQEEPNLIQPTIRKEFADTAFWTGSLITDKSG
ncbi:MAG: MG2 domain-containing protein [bacterium]